MITDYRSKHNVFGKLFIGGIKQNQIEDFSLDSSQVKLFSIISIFCDLLRALPFQSVKDIKSMQFIFYEEAVIKL